MYHRSQITPKMHPFGNHSLYKKSQGLKSNKKKNRLIQGLTIIIKEYQKNRKIDR